MERWTNASMRTPGMTASGQMHYVIGFNQQTGVMFLAACDSLGDWWAEGARKLKPGVVTHWTPLPEPPTANGE